MRFGLPPAEVGSFLHAAGWTPELVLTGSEVGRYLANTDLPSTVNPDASFATATRR